MEYLLDTRSVNRLHGLVDPEKWPTPCKGGVLLAKTAETAGGGRGRGEMKEGRIGQEEEREERGKGKEEKRKEKWKKKEEEMLTFHFKGILSLQKHYTVQRHLPTGTASIQHILQMNQLGLREIGSGTVETPSLRLQLARIFTPQGCLLRQRDGRQEGNGS